MRSENENGLIQVRVKSLKTQHIFLLDLARSCSGRPDWGTDDIGMKWVNPTSQKQITMALGIDPSRGHSVNPRPGTKVFIAEDNQIAIEV